MPRDRFNPAILYGDPVAPMRSDYGGGSDITRLLMEQGRVQAEGALQRGQIWQNAIQQGAQQLAGGFEKAAEEKKMAKRDQAWLGLINDPESMKDPRTAYAKTLSIWGPEDGPKQFQALVGVHQLGQPKRDPEADHKALVTMGGAMAKMSDPGRAALWPQAKALTASAFPELGKSLPDQYDPKVWAEQVGPLLDSMQAPKKLTEVSPGAALVDDTGKPVYTAPDKAKEPKEYEVEVPGPGGKPIKRLATAEEMRKGVQTYRAPLAPKEPKAPEWKDAEDSQGNPVLVDYASGQTKPYPGGAMPKPGAAEANRIAAADAALSHSAEVRNYLSKPEVRASIGPMMGRYNSLAQAAGAGDPVAVELVGMLKSHAALQPQIHGFRAVKFAEDIEKLFTTHQTPESLEAALRGIDSAATTVRDRRHGAPSGPKVGDRKKIGGQWGVWDGHGWAAE